LDLNRLKGYIYGSALGDAMGQPVEFKSKKSIISEYGDQGILDPPKNAIWTDDTQMMMALARGIGSERYANEEKVFDSISKSFIKWLDDPGYAPGNTCMSGVRILAKGVHWSKSGLNNSKGCGSVMRSGIVGFFFDEIEKLKHISSISGKMTHGHPAADAACIAGSLVINYALNDIKEVEYIPKLLNEVGYISKDLKIILEKTSQLIKHNIDPDEAIPDLGQGWIAEEALALALFCVLKEPNNYKKAIRMAVNITGDSDSVGCIAGGILGTKHGFTGFIPLEWIENFDATFKKNIEDFYLEMTTY
jgi:ADP-ribosylglycohydrolase